MKIISVQENEQHKYSKQFFSNPNTALHIIYFSCSPLYFFATDRSYVLVNLMTLLENLW